MDKPQLAPAELRLPAFFPGEEKEMRAKLKTAFGLVAGSFGRYTPFLVPYWDGNEFEAVNDWLAGKRFPAAHSTLTGMLKDQFGPECNIRLLNLGRSAIQLALQALELPSGSEVILPAFSCNGVAHPVLKAGLTPVFADVDTSFNLRLDSVIEAWTPNVKAMIMPHLSGCWCADADRILQWARSQGILVIEDAAQAVGLRRGDQLAGTLGDVGIFSCHGGKQILGPGGAWLVTRDPALARKLMSLQSPLEKEAAVRDRIEAFTGAYTIPSWRRGGIRLKEVVGASIKSGAGRSAMNGAPVSGYDVFAISEIEAQLALLQLPKLESMIRNRRENAARWRHLFSKVPTASMRMLPDSDNIHTKMLLSFPGAGGPAEIRALTGALGEWGVECESSYQPLYMRPQYASVRKTRMTVTESQSPGAFSIPVRPNLTEDDWKRIEGAVGEFQRRLSRRSASE
jgi:perosamine synthetase